MIEIMANEIYSHLRIFKELKMWVTDDLTRLNFDYSKFSAMEGLSIIEGHILKKWDQRLANIEQNQLALMKLIRQLLPPLSQSSVPDFISISDACKKYHISKVTINNKIKLFELNYEREIDRLQAGKFYLINELELQQAIKLKSSISIGFKKD